MRLKNRVKRWFIFLAASQLIILGTACEIRDGNERSETERVTDLESSRVVCVLKDTYRIAFQKATVMLESAEDLAGQLTRMVIALPKERERIQVIYPTEYYEDSDAERSFPKGVIREIADAFRENNLMEFIDSYAAEYEILSREEIEKYAISSDTVYNFIEEMEWINSHMVVDDEILYEKREEKIHEISETDAIWYMLPFDRSYDVIVYGKYFTYKIDPRGFERGFALSSADELHFISWGEDNLIIETEENLERVTVFYFDGFTIGNIAIIEKNVDGEPVINYYRYMLLMK